MTESTIQFSSSTEAKRWLEDQTSSVLTPVHAQAKKLRDEMNLSLQGIAEVSKSLFDISSKEIEKRNMKLYNRARALNKLSRLFLDRLKKVPAPDQVSYDIISRYVQETQKVLLVTEIDIKNWFPRISPFFIMDRRKFLASYERAKQTFNSLNDFVTKEYVKAKTLEEALLQLNDLQSIEEELTKIQKDKIVLIQEREPLEKEIEDIEQKIEELKTKGPIDKLNAANAEIENLNNDLKNMLRHLQKPFVKMQALAMSGGGGGIRPDELKKINQYLETPFEALATEQEGFPILKQILEKLREMMIDDTLKIKPDKARKAEQTVNEILKYNTLNKLQIRCIEVAAIRDGLVASSKMDETKSNLSQYQEQIEQLIARKTSIETHETVKDNMFKETEEKISNLKRTIEKNIFSAIDKKIQIM